MANLIDIKVPDIGEFDDGVEVIDIQVAVGDSVAVEDSLLTLESDKASMDIPSTSAGVVKEIMVALGDKVVEGDLLIKLEVSEAMATQDSSAADDIPVAEPVSTPPVSANESADLHVDVLVMGAGPGGYTAAFRAADLGKKVALIERHASLGGVCLNVGCIPSKALLHQAQVIHEAAEMSAHGVTFEPPTLDIDAIRGNKENIIQRLTGGLAGLAKQRNVTVVTGYANFASSHSVVVENEGSSQTISFDNAIIAAGSQPVKIPGFPYDDDRLMDSTGALALADVPEKMLVIGGGIIGLEMATVYHALGSKISVIELMDQLVAGCDKDLVKPLHKRLSKQLENIYLKAKVTAIESTDDGLKVSFEGEGVPDSAVYDRVLMSVGRRPNGSLISADKAGVNVDERGFISVDKQMRTNVPHIFAIGDVVGNPMLAHKAVHEAKVAAEVIAGEKAAFDPMTIPSVAYTDPEISWMGLTETKAKADGIKYEKSVFPWAASGRALSIGRDEGMTKILWDPETKRILGAGIVGTNAGELIAEAVLALEMGADVDDMGLTIHPHPTLSETLCFAAEMQAGSITDLYVKKK
ncbi:MAG: dihydrolipoyl dehydrogenase [Cycloclasticus pugetii]|uniref:dihydrolipoyl dehydrogenase n=1 Tax=Cycloclasticus TaxID=34067 RepID=UPI000C107ECD|nr:dihydrolipoyl dehydrogenase [Cycloclasticus sp.]PHR50877.1 MAG: dihydrolipoyl dehydrogenase [Cycloclasticus sp.]